MAPTSRTRLAPSPTGALHLGNARTFLVNWVLARQKGWTIVLRIEDLDGPRVKPETIAGTIDDLQWLGIDWDEGPFFQRADLSVYQSALHKLIDQRQAYPCWCTRKQIEAAALSAPHSDDHELRYPGTCRPQNETDWRSTRDDFFPEDPSADRLIVPDQSITVVDQIHGQVDFDLQQTTGDFLIWTRSGYPSYQLAVVVDDARQQIDQVVRGDDLLSSAARQMLLYQYLELGPPPTYTHLPLVVGDDGRRLAKRHGDTRIAHYRQSGVAAETVISLLARWCGLEVSENESVSAAEFCAAFELNRLPRHPIVHTAGDDQWLLSHAQ